MVVTRFSGDQSAQRPSLAENYFGTLKHDQTQETRFQTAPPITRQKPLVTCLSEEPSILGSADTPLRFASAVMGHPASAESHHSHR
jgi:hypothetical protein